MNSSAPTTSSRALKATIHFLPYFLTPPSANNLSNLLSLCIFLGCLSLTFKGPLPAVVRIVLFVVAAYYGHPLVTSNHDVPHRMVSAGIWFSGALSLLKVFDVCIVSLWDKEPPRWVHKGKLVLLPETPFARFVYAWDLFTTNRGSSWWEGYSWDWAPKYIALYSPPVRSRLANTARGLVWTAFLYLAIDVCETVNELETWDITHPHPVLTLSLPKQLLYSFSICMTTCLGIATSHALFTTLFVALGSSPRAWVPPFPQNPFAATSLQDFWSNRWHHYFKRPVERAAVPIMMLFPQRWPWSTRRVIRALIIFGMQTFLHLHLVARIFHVRKSETEWRFIDESTLVFFLLQPAGLLVEREVLVPLTKSIFPHSIGTRTWIARVWAWAWLLWTGRYWADVWVRSGMWNPGEGYLGWSPIRGLLFGHWFLV
ncbi:hypothetical protein DL93DRAFT_2141673 [Clavulina sp. PMI_390]|nr:hypothetical protein DL93DRAFT_2141673 [Clavulina sp. PMI_390]